MEEINLHFTGDLHAVSMAHNLLSAMLDNHLNKGNILDIDEDSIFWPRVMDMNDRSLRSITIGQGAKVNGPTRKDRFDITAASEVMAILALSKDYEDLRERLGRIVVASNSEGLPVTAEQLEAGGPWPSCSGMPFFRTLFRRWRGIRHSSTVGPSPTSPMATRQWSRTPSPCPLASSSSPGGLRCGHGRREGPADQIGGFRSPPRLCGPQRDGSIHEAPWWRLWPKGFEEAHW